MAEGGSGDSCVPDTVKEDIVEGEEDGRILCDPCSADNKQNTAVKFCIDCQEYICESCTEAHRKYRPLRHHNLAELPETSKSAKDELKNQGVVSCEKHREKQVEVFCFTHNVYCCILCATVNHKECAGLMEIPKLATTAGEKMAKLEAMYKTARTHIGTLKSLCEEEKTGIPPKTRQLEDTLDQIRDQIVSEIDSVIQDQKAQLKNRASLCDAELDARLSTLKEIVSSCEKNEESMTTAKEYGLPIHIVTTQKRTTDEYMKIEKEIEAVEKKMTKFEFEYPVMTRLEAIQQDLISCRSEEIDTVEKELDFKCYEDCVYDNTRKDMKKVEDYEVQPVPGCKPRYTGIATLGTDQVFMCDNAGGGGARGHICMYNTETKSLSKLELNKPFGVVVIKSEPTEIAVSLPGDKEIMILSYKDESFDAGRTFRTEKPPYSLVRLENGLFGVTFESPPSFDIVDIRGEEMKTLKTYTQDSTGRQFKSFQYVAVDEVRSHIIQPCERERKVFCFDFSGHPVFTFEWPGVKPRSTVCLDRDENIYIGLFSAIAILTPAGRRVGTIREGIPLGVSAISIDHNGTRVILVADYYSYLLAKLFKGGVSNLPTHEFSFNSAW